MAAIIPNPAPGLGYGGSEYGYSPYGSWAEPRQPYPVSGGFGGSPYGYAAFGSVDITPPRVSSAVSLDGYRVEIFFTEAMRNNADLVNPLSYTFTDVLGAPCVTVSVATGVASGSGFSSVIVTHTGTTLGGSYVAVVSTAVVDVVGNVIVPTARTAAFYAKGGVPSFTATPEDGSHVVLQFSEDMLTEVEFSPGIEDPAAYGTSTAYPVDLNITGIEHPYHADASQVRLTVEGMTSTTYGITVSPASAIEYDGSVLPSADSSFAGSEVGTGTSTAGGTGLLLTKATGVTYGWDFADTSGRVLPSSSFRVDITFDASAAVFTPALYDAALCTFTISDGAVQVVITLTRVAGIDVIEVVSGVYTVQVPVVWSAGATTLTLLRNQMADTYALVVDDEPIVSAVSSAFTGVPTISPGVRVLLDTTYDVVSLPVTAVTVTATQTVFSNAWNFLHGVSTTFTGSSALTRATLLTKRGPLVKDWGDPTPATVADVTLRVNDVVVGVAAVNPYLGLITPSIPIPLTTAGSTSIDIDYTWFPNPVFPMPGLNIPGVVLNQWHQPQGWHPPRVKSDPKHELGRCGCTAVSDGVRAPSLHEAPPRPNRSSVHRVRAGLHGGPQLADHASPQPKPPSNCSGCTVKFPHGCVCFV